MKTIVTHTIVIEYSLMGDANGAGKIMSNSPSHEHIAVWVDGQKDYELNAKYGDLKDNLLTGIVSRFLFDNQTNCSGNARNYRCNFIDFMRHCRFKLFNLKQKFIKI